MGIKYIIVIADNAVCEKSFALNEQYRLPDNKPQARELLTEDIRMSVENVEQVGSRVVVKGKVWAEIWYLPDESNQAVKTEFSSPFSQIVDTGAEAAGAGGSRLAGCRHLLRQGPGHGSPRCPAVGKQGRAGDRLSLRRLQQPSAAYLQQQKHGV